MKLSYWFALSLATVAIAGCAREAVNNSTSQDSVAIASSASSPSPQSTLVSQFSKPGATIVKTGSFASGEHETKGTVRVVTQNGKSFLELDQTFKTSQLGPDLVVILHRSDNVLGSTKPPAYPLQSGDYVLLAPLRKFSGVQRYAIPANVNLDNYNSAVIWCRKFNATFGSAKLST